MGIREPFAPNESYHIYNRGTEKRTIFLVREDYERFLALLYLCNSERPLRLENIRREQGSTLLKRVLEIDKGLPLVDIGAYVLMPNHFHLLVRVREEKGVSQFMQRILTAYTMYFNIRNERTGALFQGKFKSQHAGSDRYLKYLFSYIHLNPIKILEPHWKEGGIENKERVKRFLEEYRYSSYLDYAGRARSEGQLLNIHAFPAYFDSSVLLSAHMEDWLEYRSSVI